MILEFSRLEYVTVCRAHDCSWMVRYFKSNVYLPLSDIFLEPHPHIPFAKNFPAEDLNRVRHLLDAVNREFSS